MPTTNRLEISSLISLTFARVRRVEILIFDQNSSSQIVPLLSSYRFSIFPNDARQLNLRVILRMIWTGHFSWFWYCVNYIRMSGASLVVTGVDTNASFYFFKTYIPNCGFVAIQNGFRTDIATTPDNGLRSQLITLGVTHGYPNIDRFLSLGRSHSLFYPSAISQQSTPVGSLRNNSIVFDKSKRREPKVVSFISQVSESSARAYFSQPTREILFIHGQAITAEQFLRADRLVCRSLAEICHLRGWSLQVIGRTLPSEPLEAKLFFEACAGFQLQFCDKVSEDSPYLAALSSDVSISISSTFGYELLSRGHRVVFLNSRLQDTPREISQQYLFGHPEPIDENGAFWSSELDPTVIGNLIQKVMSTSEAEWLSQSFQLSQSLLKFDPGNRCAKNEIDQILCQYR